MAEQASEEIYVLKNRQRGIKILAKSLRHVSDARTDVGAVAGRAQVASQHLDLPSLNLTRARDECQQARLTDAVRPNQPDHLPGRYRDANPIKGANASVTQRHSIEAGHHLVSEVHCGTLICKLSGHWASGSKRR